MENAEIVIVQKKIADLIPAEYNPRQLTEKQFEDISASIKRFGFVDPVLVNTHPDRKNIIIGGHMRTRVAKELGYKQVPCVELYLTLEKEKELNIRLNKNTGSFDFDALADHFEIEDLTDWGFAEYEFGVEYNDEQEDIQPLELGNNLTLKGIKSSELDIFKEEIKAWLKDKYPHVKLS